MPIDLKVIIKQRATVWSWLPKLTIAHCLVVMSLGAAQVLAEDLNTSCDDGIRNHDESGIDCGGTVCAPCTEGESCLSDQDCADEQCLSGVCVQPSCDDGVHNQSETDIDCGGSCEPCEDGRGCLTSEDCVIGHCYNQRCVIPSCDDGIRNQDETDRDCGGTICAPCADGLRCELNGDCVFAQCLLSVCVAPSCDDGVQGLDESDIDCGGPICAQCNVGERCGSHADCASRRCVSELTGKRCVAPSCEDLTQNGDESDVDCGGGCGACPDLYTCRVDADCESTHCRDQRCVAPSCDDGRHNGNETDIDCGGNDCAPCTPTLLCDSDEDCDSELCLGQRCAEPTCFDLRMNQNETGVDCGGACEPCVIFDLDMALSTDMSLRSDQMLPSDDMTMIDEGPSIDLDMGENIDFSLDPEFDMGGSPDLAVDMVIFVFDQEAFDDDMAREEVDFGSDRSVIEISADQGVTADQSMMAELDSGSSKPSTPANVNDDEVYDPSVFSRERPKSGCDHGGGFNSKTKNSSRVFMLIMLLLILNRVKRREIMIEDIHRRQR